MRNFTREKKWEGCGEKWPGIYVIGSGTENANYRKLIASRKKKPFSVVAICKANISECGEGIPCEGEWKKKWIPCHCRRQRRRICHFPVFASYFQNFAIQIHILDSVIKMGLVFKLKIALIFLLLMAFKVFCLGVRLAF